MPGKITGFEEEIEAASKKERAISRKFKSLEEPRASAEWHAAYKRWRALIEKHVRHGGGQIT